MNKAELVSRLAAETSSTRAATERMAGAVFSAIADALARDESLATARFGKFAVQGRDARQGCNFRTEGPFDLPLKSASIFPHVNGDCIMTRTVKDGTDCNPSTQHLPQATDDIDSHHDQSSTRWVPLHFLPSHRCHGDYISPNQHDAPIQLHVENTLACLFPHQPTSSLEAGNYRFPKSPSSSAFSQARMRRQSCTVPLAQSGKSISNKNLLFRLANLRVFDLMPFIQLTAISRISTYFSQTHFPTLHKS